MLLPRRSVPLILATVLVAAFAAGCGDDDDADRADAAPGGVPSTLRLAVTDLQGLEELQREFGAFEAELEKSLGSKVEFFPVANRTAAAAALAGEQVDLVFTGPAEYVVLRSRTAVQPVIAIKRADYRACVYVPADSAVKTLDDLRGKAVAMSDIGSTSGHLGPSQLFVDAGIDPQEEIDIKTVGDAAHQALLRDDVAAVGVGCHDRDEYVEGKEGDFRTIVRGDSLPPDVIVANDDLSAEAVAKVRGAFQANWPTLLKAMLEGKDNAKYAGAELVEVDDGDYDVVRSMYKAIGVEDTDEFVGD